MFFSDLTILNSRYVEIMNKCPSDKEAQEYSKWTQELKKIAKLSDDDYEETRNISTCARYLSVSCVIQRLSGVIYRLSNL